MRNTSTKQSHSRGAPLCPSYANLVTFSRKTGKLFWKPKGWGPGFSKRYTVFANSNFQTK
jgi:hypothetical protein